MLSIRLLLAGWALLGCRYTIVQAQLVRLSGQIDDYRSHRPVAGSWQWTDSMQHPLSGAVFSKGSFTGTIPATTRYLTVTGSGYRSVQLPVHGLPSSVDSLSFQVVIPLVPIDTPVTNQPYFQSEQRPLRLPTAVAPGPGRRFRFTISDALTNRPVRAELCLFSTRKTGPDCYTVSTLQTRFIPPDVVAIEARAPSYQPYLGNVVIMNSGNRPTLAIRLNPTPVVLMVTIRNGSKPAGLRLTALSTRLNYPLNTVDNIHFWGTVPSGLYQLSSREGSLTRDTLRLTEGLSGYVLPSARLTEKLNQTDVIYFDQSSYELSNPAKRKLDLLADQLHQQPDLKVRITGHTDNIGNPQLNQTLSEFRAKMVQSYLKRAGIGDGQMSTEAIGARQPVAPNDTEESRQQNRRVSLYVR